MNDDNGQGNSLLALIVVMFVCVGLISVVLKFADEIDGIKQPVTQHVVTK